MTRPGQGKPPSALPSAAVGAMLRGIGIEIERRRWVGSTEAHLQAAMATMLAEVTPPGPLVPFTVHREYILPPAEGMDALQEPPESMGAILRAHREIVVGNLDAKITRPAGRLDFAVVLEAKAPNVIAIELKVAGGTTEVARQVQRYAGHPDVAAIVLATTAPRLAWGMPRALGGKPVIGVIMRRM